jgi:hypothetical protein
MVVELGHSDVTISHPLTSYIGQPSMVV